MYFLNFIIKKVAQRTTFKRKFYAYILYIEQEVHHITILNDVRFSFNFQFTSFSGFSFSSIFNKIILRNQFVSIKFFFNICILLSSSLRCVCYSFKCYNENIISHFIE